MTFLLSASLGAAAGILDARLALRPVLVSPLRLSPRHLVLRFLLRVSVLATILALLITAGAEAAVLLPCLVGGFITQSTVIIWKAAA